jgi:RNA polymerase sigma-70 factor (ECF subfamily)
MDTVIGLTGSPTGSPARSDRQGAERPGFDPPERSSGGSARSEDSGEARRVKALLLAGQHDEGREAFASLVARHQRQASRLALYLLRDGAEADEAVQDAFVKVFTHIGSYREDLPFEAWFTRILVNTCRDRQKARRRRDRWQVGGLDSSSDGTQLVETAASNTPSPEEQVLQAERRRTIAKAIDALPERQREVFLLCHADGRSSRDVGSLTGLNESTVRVHLFRAIRKLRDALEDTRVRR